MNEDRHRVIREQIGAHALGQLDADRQPALLAHLRACPSCRAVADQISPVARLLASSRQGSHPSSPAARIPPPGPPSRGGRGRRRAWAAAAILVIALGAGGYRIGALGGSSSLAADVGAAVAVRLLDPAVRADVFLTSRSWGTEITLVASGFTAGTTYLVTVTDAARRTSGAGSFVGTGTDPMRCNLTSPVLRSEIRSFRITAGDGRVVLTGDA